MSGAPPPGAAPVPWDEPPTTLPPGVTAPDGAAPSVLRRTWSRRHLLLLSGAPVLLALAVPVRRSRARALADPVPPPLPVPASPVAPLWADEFDGPPGAGVDPGVWTTELGAGGWGNGELEDYTARPENLSLDGAGNLRITMLREDSTDAQGRASRFTSARIRTVAAYDAGRIEARMRIPLGIGLWSAFWTLGSDQDRVGWPRCGEIDIAEHYDGLDVVDAVAHGAEVAPDGSTLPGRGWSVPVHPRVDDPTGRWHVYAVDLEATRLTFSIDGRTCGEVARSDQVPGHDWPFDQPQRLVLDLAMSRWRGDDDTTALPATLLVDYVRVYPRTTGGDPIR